MKPVAKRHWAFHLLVALVALMSLVGFSRLALAQDASIDPTAAEVSAAQGVDANAGAAAASGCSANAGWTADADTFKGAVGTLLSPFNAADATIASTANTYAGNVMRNALTLGGILATTYIMWSILRFLADGNGNYAALVIDSMVPVAMVSGVLANYSAIVSDLQNLFNSMIPAQGGISSQIATLAQGFMSGIGTALKAMWNSLGCGGDSGVAVYLHAFCVGVLMIIAAILAILALAEIVGVLFTGSVLMGVGIAVGPYFIAAGVCRWSYDYMTKWLNFLMGALFYKSLISIVLYLVTGVVSSVVQNVTNYNGTTGFPLGNAVALIGVMWILKHVFQSIPGIASALIGGGNHHAPSLNAAVESGMKTAAKANRALNEYSEAKAKQKIEEQKRQEAAGGQGGTAGASGPSAATQGPSFSPAAASSGGSAGGAGNASHGSSGSNSGGSAAPQGAQPSGNGPRFTTGNNVNATDVAFREVTGAQAAPGSAGPQAGTPGSGGQAGPAGGGGFQVD